MGWCITRYVSLYVCLHICLCVCLRVYACVAVYLCKRTMQNKQRLELADYEAENLARLQKTFSRKWELIFMQAEAQAKSVTSRCLIYAAVNISVFVRYNKYVLWGVSKHYIGPVGRPTGSIDIGPVFHKAGS